MRTLSLNFSFFSSPELFELKLSFYDHLFLNHLVKHGETLQACGLYEALPDCFKKSYSMQKSGCYMNKNEKSSCPESPGPKILVSSIFYWTRVVQIMNLGSHVLQRNELEKILKSLFV